MIITFSFNYIILDNSFFYLLGDILFVNFFHFPFIYGAFKVILNYEIKILKFF